MKKHRGTKRTKKEASMDPDPTQSAQTPLRENPGSGMSPTVILEPTTITVPERVPWYRRFIGGGGARTQNVWKLSFVMMILLAALVTLRGAQPQTLVTKAGLNRASVSLKPIQAKLPPDSYIQLWISSEATVTRGDILISFDPKLVTLADYQAPNQSELAKALTLTPKAQANSTGLLMVQLDTTKQKIAAPNGTFQLLNMTFRRAAGATGTTDITIMKDSLRLFHDESPFTISGISNSSVTLGAGK
jgi:hypothetical protein